MSVNSFVMKNSKIEGTQAGFLIPIMHARKRDWRRNAHNECDWQEGRAEGRLAMGRHPNGADWQAECQG